MTTWFTSDTHFGHANIMKFEPGRPGKDIEEHDEILIKNWNDCVQKGDTIYHLGDFCFISDMNRVKKILRRLNGQKFLVVGNHDRRMFLDMCRSERLFVKIDKIMDIKIEDKDVLPHKQVIILSHFPQLVWNKCYHGSWHLFGHCHGNLRDPVETKRMDVGTDCHNFRPISYQEVKAVMNQRRYVPVDHHDDECGNI